jgi:hypothetical protein
MSTPRLVVQATADDAPARISAHALYGFAERRYALRANGTLPG